MWRTNKGEIGDKPPQEKDIKDLEESSSQPGEEQKKWVTREHV